MEFTPPRGTEDLLPPGAHAMAWLYERVHRLLHQLEVLLKSLRESAKLLANFVLVLAEDFPRSLETLGERGAVSEALR